MSAWAVVLNLTVLCGLVLVLYELLSLKRKLAGRTTAERTRLEQSADQLDKLAARNRAILRSAMDGFFIVNEDYRFQEVNDAFCRMTGYSADELQRLKITDLEVAQPANGMADFGSPRSGLYQFATAHRHKDGHLIRLETSVIVLRDGARKILVGFARDVTERLRAEETLERLSRQNQLILDSAAEGIYGVDLDGRFTFVNSAAARMLGRAAAELIGQPAHGLLGHARPDGAVVAAERCPLCRPTDDGLAEHQTEEVFRRRDGSSFAVELLCSPILEQAQVTGAVVVFRDISERKQAEEERRALEVRFQQTQKLESLGILAGGLAHDFNNLLLSILCNASLAGESLPADSAVRAQLEKIVKAGRRASDLTRQMLAYAGQAACDVQPLAFNELVDEVTDFMQAALPKSVTLQVQLDPELPPIEADHAQLQQIIMNLVINAAEAVGARPGTVTVRTGLRKLARADIGPQFVGYDLAPGNYVSLEVRDTGCGMSPDTLARIFDPFFSTKAPGRGLGLSALLGIVRAHRGAVRAVSQPGAGTTFTVVFPAASRPLRRVAGQRPHLSVPAGATVLVIDDEEDIREVVQAVLESRGLRVLTAKDGDTGVALFRENQDGIDAVLLDMTMPGLSGEAVFRELLRIRPDARVVLSSGHSEQEALARLGDGRMVGFVHKPYTAEMLTDSIAAALAGRTTTSGPSVAKAELASTRPAPGPRDGSAEAASAIDRRSSS